MQWRSIGNSIHLCGKKSNIFAPKYPKEVFATSSATFWSTTMTDGRGGSPVEATPSPKLTLTLTPSSDQVLITLDNDGASATFLFLLMQIPSSPAENHGTPGNANVPIRSASRLLLSGNAPLEFGSLRENTTHSTTTTSRHSRHHCYCCRFMCALILCC